MTWTTLAAAVTFWCIGAAWGAGMSRRSDDYRYARLVADDASQRSAIRDLYVAEGYEPPDFYAESEPEPGPSRRERIVAWVKARFRGRAAEEKLELVAPIEPLVGEVDPLVGEVEPDTGPETDEWPIVGPPTQPVQAVIADDWQRESEALYQQMLAEIRGEKVEESAA